MAAMDTSLQAKLSLSLDELSERRTDRRRGEDRDGGGGRYRDREDRRSSRRERTSNPYKSSRSSSGKGDDEVISTGPSSSVTVRVLTNRLFVGNLDYHVSWQDLKDHFKQVGEVVFADVLKEPGGSRSKGCGIVEMSTKEEAVRAIKELNDTELNKRPIWIREDREDKKSPFIDDFRQSRPERERYVDRYRDRNMRSRGDDYGTAQVFVGNLSYQTTWQDLKDKFRSAGNVIRADVLLDDQGQSKGTGTVLFETVADAHRAIQMYTGTDFMGREILVHEDKFAK